MRDARGASASTRRSLQKIADNSTDPVYPGTRAAGTEGYTDSVEYVTGLPKDAGYEVTLDPVEITFNFPATLRQLTPVEAEYETGVFTGSGSSGTVEGTVIPVDINLNGDRASTSGCEAADFAGLDFSGAADIALVQRGTCFFGTKAFYAEQAGAEAVIIFNQGNTPEREGLIVADATSVDPPILGAPGPVTHGIPVMGASFDDGVALAAAGSTAFVEVVPADIRTDYNVIAELPRQEQGQRGHGRRAPRQRHRGAGDQGQRLRLGRAARDRPPDGQPEPREHLGFDGGPVRSRVCWDPPTTSRGFARQERDRIALYMNYDMVGSPNYIFMVYDSDQSTFRGAEYHPAGSPSRISTSRTTRRSVSRTTTPSSRAGATTRPSSSPAFPPAACSRAPRRSRPRSRKRSGAGPRASSSTPATTWPATRSRTSTTTRSRSTAT